MSLEDVPKKVQYIIIDSNFVTGSNNTFSLDLQLKSNTHIEDMSRVLGIKMVDFYITQVGENDSNLNTNVAKYVDIICPDVPKVAQILDERRGQIFARVPLKALTGSNGMFTGQASEFLDDNKLFNPISVKKLNLKYMNIKMMGTMFASTRCKVVHDT